MNQSSLKSNELCFDDHLRATTIATTATTTSKNSNNNRSKHKKQDKSVVTQNLTYIVFKKG